MTQLIDELAPDDELTSGGGTRDPRARPLPGRRPTRTPTATRSARCSRRSSPSTSSARTPSCTSPATRRCRSEYSFMPLDGSPRELPDDAGERMLVAVDCANATRIGPDLDARSTQAPFTINIDHHHDNTRFGDVNLIVAGRLVDRRGAARPLRRARRRAHARDRRAALHRARHRHRPLPVHEHDAEGAAPRGRARRGGRRRPPRLPGRLRVGRVREAEAARARARAGRDLRGRPARRLAPRCASDFVEVGAAEAVRRGDHRLPARRRRRRHGRADPRAAARRRARRGACQPAGRADELDVSAIARKSGGGGHRQAAGFSSEQLGRRDHRLHPPGVPAAATACRAVPRALSPAGVVLVDKPAGPVVVRGRRAAAATARARGPGTRARSTRSRPGSCSCSPARRRSSRSASSGSTSAT